MGPASPFLFGRGAPKSWPMISQDNPDEPALGDGPPEVEEDFAFEESSGVDLMTELEAPESVRRGVAVIKSHWKNAPNGARRLSHDRGGRRGALCRQGQERAQARRELHAARRPCEPHRADDRRHRRHGFHLGRDRDRRAAAGSQSHQAVEAALQRADARRQVVSLYSDRPGSRRAADHQASRRARPQGRLFRPIRQRLGGQSRAQRIAAGVSAALLRRLVLRKPHAAVFAVSNQALRRSVHRRDLDRRLRGAGRRGEGLFDRQEPARARAARRGNDAGGGAPGVRARGAAA